MRIHIYLHTKSITPKSSSASHSAAGHSQSPPIQKVTPTPSHNISDALTSHRFDVIARHLDPIARRGEGSKRAARCTIRSRFSPISPLILTANPPILQSATNLATITYESTPGASSPFAFHVSRLALRPAHFFFTAKKQHFTPIAPPAPSSFPPSPIQCGASFTPAQGATP
jgi:hypothetical protein